MTEWEDKNDTDGKRQEGGIVVLQNENGWQCENFNIIHKIAVVSKIILCSE